MTSLVCTYASKPCSEPRAVKENGELHRLCEFHRDKANETQRRWHARHQHVKRVRASLSRVPGHQRRASEPLMRDANLDAIQWAAPPERRHQSMAMMHELTMDEAPFFLSTATSEGGALSAEDLALLSELLVGDDDHDDYAAQDHNTEEYQFIV